MLESFKNKSKLSELQKRIFFSFLFLTIYRIGVHIPVPGIDTKSLAIFFEQAKGSLLGLFDLFSGGALSNFSVFSLGIMPYISASIILQLMTLIIPQLEKLSKEGEIGRKKITQYTRYGAILLSFIQGIGISIGLEHTVSPIGTPIVLVSGWNFRFITIITLVAGTAFIMWLGEQITEKGIGNGISLIIFAGIVCRGPSAIINTYSLLSSGELNIILIFSLLIAMLLIMTAIVFVETAQRKIPVQYAKRIIGRKIYVGQSTHLPLKINTAGVIPPIFASSIIMFPATIANFIPHPCMKIIVSYLKPGVYIYEILYITLIIFFCYFYTAISFNSTDVAENMKKNGGYIAGIRPGKKTAEYIDIILTRLTFSGSIYISLICLLPSMIISYFNVPFYFGGTALLIIVGVALDTIGQIEIHLLTKQYESFIKKNRKIIKK